MRFAIRHHSELAEVLGLELRRPSWDSLFHDFFHQVALAALFAAVSDRPIAKSPGGAADLDLMIYDGNPLQATHLFIASLRITSEAMSPLLRDRCSMDGWHLIRDNRFHMDAHRYRDRRAGAMATLLTDALNLLKLVGCRSMWAGMQSVMLNITALLPMGRRQPELNRC